MPVEPRMAGPERDTEAVRGAENLLIAMEENWIWPDGPRNLWTDAYGLALLASLYEATGKEHFLHKAVKVVEGVDRTLGRPNGYRIGEAPERDGQYFHSLAMWVYALWRASPHIPEYHDKAVGIVKDIHPAFVNPEAGVVWKMQEDLSEPYPGTGMGTIDPYHGHVVYRLLDPEALQEEIREMRALMERTQARLRVEQDLGLGVMLWLTHFFPDEEWARGQRERSLGNLNLMWHDPPGCFVRAPLMPETCYAFTNYGIAVALQAIGHWTERVERLLSYFQTYRSGDQYDIDPITHVMRAAAVFPDGFLARGLPPVLRRHLHDSGP